MASQNGNVEFSSQTCLKRRNTVNIPPRHTVGIPPMYCSQEMKKIELYKRYSDYKEYATPQFRRNYCDEINRHNSKHYDDNNVYGKCKPCYGDFNQANTIYGTNYDYGHTINRVPSWEPEWYHFPFRSQVRTPFTGSYDHRQGIIRKNSTKSVRKILRDGNSRSGPEFYYPSSPDILYPEINISLQPSFNVSNDLSFQQSQMNNREDASEEMKQYTSKTVTTKKFRTHRFQEISASISQEVDKMEKKIQKQSEKIFRLENQIRKTNQSTLPSSASPVRSAQEDKNDTPQLKYPEAVFDTKKCLSLVPVKHFDSDIIQSVADQEKLLHEERTGGSVANITTESLITKNISKIVEEIDPVGFDVNEDYTTEEKESWMKYVTALKDVTKRKKRAILFLVDILSTRKDLMSLFLENIRKTYPLCNDLLFNNRSKLSFCTYKPVVAILPEEDISSTESVNCVLKLLKDDNILITLLENTLLSPEDVNTLMRTPQEKAWHENALIIIKKCGITEDKIYQTVTNATDNIPFSELSTLSQSSNKCCVTSRIDCFQSPAKSRKEKIAVVKIKLERDRNKDYQTIIEMLEKKRTILNKQLEGVAKIDQIWEGSVVVSLKFDTSSADKAETIVRVFRRFFDSDEMIDMIQEEKVHINVSVADGGEDGDDELVATKLAILANYDDLLEEIDAYHFKKIFLMKNIMDNETFDHKFEIYSNRRRKTYLFLEYLLNATRNVMDIFMESIEEKQFRFVADKIKKALVTMKKEYHEEHTKRIDSGDGKTTPDSMEDSNCTLESKVLNKASEENHLATRDIATEFDDRTSVKTVASLEDSNYTLEKEILIRNSEEGHLIKQDIPAELCERTFVNNNEITRFNNEVPTEKAMETTENRNKANEKEFIHDMFQTEKLDTYPSYENRQKQAIFSKRTRRHRQNFLNGRRYDGKRKHRSDGFDPNEHVRTGDIISTIDKDDLDEDHLPDDVVLRNTPDASKTLTMRMKRPRSADQFIEDPYLRQYLKQLNTDNGILKCFALKQMNINVNNCTGVSLGRNNNIIANTATHGKDSD